MDVYKFINSKDIRSHCEKTSHKFNSLETAFLIYQSDHHTTVEKHAAWNELICTMPDVVIRRRANCEHHDSLHEFLRKYMTLENKLLENLPIDTLINSCCYIDSKTDADMFFKQIDYSGSKIFR